MDAELMEEAENMMLHRQPVSIWKFERLYKGIRDERKYTGGKPRNFVLEGVAVFAIATLATLAVNATLAALDMAWAKAGGSK
jgi:hypothetical protein